jgi:hypothetical protein
VSDNDEQTEQLALPGQRITVTLNDGSQFAVQVANRDYLAWDMTAPKKGWDNDSQKMLFMNFLAWSAARRSGQFPGPFDRTEDSWWETVADIDPEKVAARPTPQAAAHD